MENIDTLIAAVIRIITANGRFDIHTGLADIQFAASQLALALCIVFISILVYVVIQRRSLKMATVLAAPTETSGSAARSGALHERWQGIAAYLDSSHENDWKTAILEADKLVDVALRDSGFGGQTFGDRLTNISPGTLVSLDGLWWAHRVRNRVAHEMDYFLRYTEARQAVSYYQATLNELKLI